MAKMTFKQFKDKLELTGTGRTADGKEEQFLEAPMGGHYEIEIDGERLSIKIIIYVPSRNRFYLPNDDGELESTDEYLNMSDDEEHDFKLLAVRYVEV